MRIAFVTTMSSNPWGASESLWVATAHAALDAGHPVAAYVYRWPERAAHVAQLAARGALISQRRRTHEVRIYRRLKRLEMLPFRSLRSWCPDVVFINLAGTFDAFNSPVASIPAKLLNDDGVPYVIFSNANGDPAAYGLNETRRDQARTLFSEAVHVCMLSQVETAIVERQLAMKLRQAVIVRNPVNLCDTSCVDWPEGPTIRFANVARLQPRDKGQDVLLEVLSDPSWKARDWQLKIYGQGPSRAYLERLAAFYGLSDRMVLPGYVSDIRQIWGQDHLLVMPSRIEGLPLSLIEAMLCGRPSVMTDVGGMREWIEDGQTGFVAEAPTAFSFHRALERAWQARDRWQAIGQAAHDRAAAQLDPQPGETLLALLEDVARRPA